MDAGVVTVHGSDDDGWIRLTVNVAALADAGQTEFDSIVFKDVSGGGHGRAWGCMGAAGGAACN